MENMEESKFQIQIEEDLTQNNPFVSLIQEDLNKILGLFKSKQSIYRVPERLKSSKEEAKAYTPKVVSIGPIHYGTNKDVLSRMEDYKLFFFNEFLKRTSHPLTYYDEIMKEKEVQLRSFYSETLQHLNSEKFLKIILIDATFIIEFLLRYFNYNSSEASTSFDYIFKPSISTTWLLQDIQSDLLLLENQIPFFVLDDLYDLIKYTICQNTNEVISIKKLIREFWKPTLWGIENTKLEDIKDIQHLLDFVWKSYISVATPQQNNLISKVDDHENQSKHQENEKENFKNILSIMQLNDCGVVFKENKEMKNLFDITFDDKKGILFMPRLRIDDYTYVIFRNLIAYEQCNCEEKLLSNYLWFLDYLVKTPDDVHLLVKNDIFENWLGDDNDVASLINKLCVGVIINDVSYFTKVGAQLNKYCSLPLHNYRSYWRLRLHNYRSYWHKAKANLKQKYYNITWAFIALIASTSLLVLTFLQTVYTIMQSQHK